MRITRQQKLLEAILDQARAPLTAQEIWEEARSKMATLGQATVYRQLQSGLERGWIRQVEMPGKSARFEKNRAQHCHYFICRSCSQMQPLNGCPGNLQTLLPKGCQLQSHEIILYGTCSSCLQKPHSAESSGESSGLCCIR